MLIDSVDIQRADGRTRDWNLGPEPPRTTPCGLRPERVVIDIAFAFGEPANMGAVPYKPGRGAS